MEIRKEYRGKQWVATFGDYHSVTAPTKTEARELAYKTMEEMVSDSYLPRVIRYGDEMVLIYRQPQGWGYQFVRGEGDGRLDRGSSCTGSWANADEVERNVRTHLAQIATCRSEGDPLTDHSAFILNDEDRGEYLRWLQWQRSVRAALNDGATMEQAREIADRARYAA